MYKQNIMARNLENSTSENSNVQEMGLWRSVRLNATISGAAPPPRVSTTEPVVRSMVPSPRPRPCHPRLMAPRPRPKPCHPSLHGPGPKPHISMHHILRNPLPWPNLLPSSSPLSGPNLLILSSLFS
ncbi:hypothetical protein ACFXTO_013582 [Malus domestica]